jgi:hypothetical protein
MLALEMSDLRLYKFGERRNIHSLAHRGNLYLSPASKYADENLGAGVYDPNELVLEQRLPEGVEFEVFDRKTSESKGILKPVSLGPMVAELQSNYYVFSMSYRYGTDLYAEFNADTCLVIADPDRFINQACKAIMAALPGWAVDAGTVRYRNPTAFYSLYPVNQDVYYGKRDEYRRQCEIRIVCTPPSPIPSLDPRVVCIGNLYGYTFITGVESPGKMIESEYSNALGSPFKYEEAS